METVFSWAPADSWLSCFLCVSTDYSITHIFCFCFTLNDSEWNTTQLSAQTSICSQSMQSLLLGCKKKQQKNKQRSCHCQGAQTAACCWPPNHSEGAQHTGAVVHLCVRNAWLLEAHPACLRKQKDRSLSLASCSRMVKSQKYECFLRKLRMKFKKADQ